MPGTSASRLAQGPTVVAPGLGLNLVREITQLHGGSVAVVNAASKSACLKMSFLRRDCRLQCANGLKERSAIRNYRQRHKQRRQNE